MFNAISMSWKKFHSTTSNPITFKATLILSPHLRLNLASVHIVYLVHISLVFHACHMSRSSHPLNLNILIIFEERYRIWNCFLRTTCRLPGKGNWSLNLYVMKNNVYLHKTSIKMSSIVQLHDSLFPGTAKILRWLVTAKWTSQL
jgi:hypothetical protein